MVYNKSSISYDGDDDDIAKWITFLQTSYAFIFISYMLACFTFIFKLSTYLVLVFKEKKMA